MADAPAIRELRIEDFEFDFTRQDNLVFANNELAPAGAEIDAGAQDEADAFAAFAQNDFVLEDMNLTVTAQLDAQLVAAPHPVAKGQVIRRTAPTGLFGDLTERVVKYLKELTSSTDARAGILKNFADSNTIAATPLVDLTLNAPPANAGSGPPAGMPPGTGGNPRRNVQVPTPAHDQAPALPQVANGGS